MRRIVSQHALHPATQRTGGQASVCVVDPRPTEYRPWQAPAAARGLNLAIFTSAEEALRHAHVQQVDLWLVNTELPGLSGYELCAMLQDRPARTAVYLASERHSPAAERAAWASRATLYCCKLAHLALLDEWWRRHNEHRPRGAM